jgi:ketosteroid isomerase-like protein
MTNGPDAPATVSRLLDATNRHDVEGIVACFSPGYRNETPVHPLRGFLGAEQVRRNWTAILGGVPDLVAEISASVVDGDTVWTEWRMTGTRRDGAAHEMAGIVIFTVDVDGLITAARFYLEPVERDSGGIDATVTRQFAEPAAR